MFARNVARERHHRRRAEQADVNAWCCKLGGCGSNREITARHQLTTSRRRDALDGGDNRLRQIHDLLHHRAAQLHNVFEISAAAIRVGSMTLELLYVMAGGESRTIGSGD